MNNFIPRFILENQLAGLTQGRLSGFTMFVDLSGFTALTVKLMNKGTKGAEELSQTLNLIFQPTVAQVYENGGFIPYFAGDSFTGIFPLESDNQPEKYNQATRIISAARAMLRRFQDDSEKDPILMEHKIGIKIGIAFGDLEWGIVGERHKSFYFRGEAIDSSAMAQGKAAGEEIVSTFRFFELLPDYQEFIKDIGGDFYKISKFPETANNSQLTADNSPLTANYSQLISEYLPKEVLEYQGIGEFRSVVTVFIAFNKISTHEQMCQFAGRVIEECYQFSGYFKEIDFGDKGGMFTCLFGAPVAFENSIERALEFIASLREALHGAEFKIGITSGIAFTGLIGGEQRNQYAAVGAHVNLAARIMAGADWGEVITDGAVQRNRNFKFTFKGESRYKGFEEPVPTYILTGRNLSGRNNYSGTYFGRQSEMNKIMQFVQPFREGRFVGVAFVFGEPGIGKSRFSYEFRKQLREMMAVSWYNCQSDQILRKAFNPFIYFLKNYFEQSPENSETKNREIFESNFLELMYDLAESKHAEADTMRRELARTQSVLAALVGLHYQGSLWEQLDARSRYQNTMDAMSALFLGESLLQPVVIELEDAHWYDEMSRDFLSQFIRRVSAYPIFILVTSRYEDDGSKNWLFRKSQLTELDVWGLEIDLNFLQPADIKAFAEHKLGGKLGPELQELLQRMTQGNPFYLEQMTEYFIETDLILDNHGLLELKKQDVPLSDSVKQIMIARIDRLSGLVKETVKAAAVIGREFELPVLSEVMSRQQEFMQKNGDLANVLKEQVQTAEKWQIWHAMNELRYIFRHSLLREAAYDMQLNTRLVELHRMIAEAIQHLYPKSEERFMDLAFHYEQSEDEKMTRKYWEKAAKYAQRNFQNKQAVHFYTKLIESRKLQKKKNQKYIRFLMRRGTIYELVGRWDLAEADYLAALEAANALDNWDLIGRSKRHFGQLLMLKGDYTEAKKTLEKTVTAFEMAKDEIGIGKTYGNLGTLFFRQGAYEDAKKRFSEAIAINRAHDRDAENSSIVANLGLVFMNQGNYDEGIRWLEEQLQIAEKADDKPGLNTLYTNLGIIYLEKGAFDSALLCLEKGLAFSEELGNKLLMTICIGCIGSVWEKKGDYEKAMQNFDRDLLLTRELGDKQGASIAHGLIGDLMSIKGDFDLAIEHLEENLRLSRALNYKKGIAKALNTLGDTWFFKGDIEKASSYYSEAIEHARVMGNRLVLGNSLIEKGAVLLFSEDVAAARRYLQEGREMALALDNHGLLFSASILQAKIAAKEQNLEGAKQQFFQIIALARSDREAAAAHFELYKIAAETETDFRNNHLEEALRLYQILFAQTPEYLFKIRIRELETLEVWNLPTPLH